MLGFPVVTATYRWCPVTYGYRVLRLTDFARDGTGPPSAASSVGQHRTDVGFGDGCAVHPGVAVKPPHGLAPADAAHVIFDGIAGHHGFTELALVDGEKVNRARLLRALDRFDTDHAGGLRHRFDHHHPRIDRAIWKMTEERRFVQGEVLVTHSLVIDAGTYVPIHLSHRRTI